ECPAPTTRTRRPSAAARSTMAMRSASDRGRCTAAGAHDWLRAQFDQMSWRDRSGLLTRIRPVLPASLQGVDEGRDHLVDVADDAEVADREDRGFGVLVDGDDVLRALHADHVLRRAGDAGRDVHVGLDDLAGLTDLVRVGHPARVDDGTRG